MLSRTPASNEAGTASNKRSLFSKPSWSKPQNLGSSDFFHRSDQTYITATAEAERRRKEKLAKKERESARQEENEERATKRQRISEAEVEGEGEDDEDDDEESSSDDSASHGLAKETANSPAKGSLDQPKALPSPPKSISSLVSNYQQKIAERTSQVENTRPKASHIIDLDDEESSTEAPELSEIKVVDFKKAAALDEDEATASDEEFPELARKAREKARRNRLEQDMASLTADLPSSADHKTSYISPPTTATPPVDPVLQILITSTIPNTTPLIVSRKLGQRLKDVRQAWANRQGFSSDFTDNIFLTWRGKRLFDVTTCKSLGVTVDLDGRVLAKGDVLGDDEGRIHMEAMTSEILEARRNAKKEAARKAEEMDLVHETPRKAEDKTDNQVRIILKAQSFEEFKLKVKPATLISKIVNAFRQANAVDTEKDVYIMFEGERLAPSSTVEDAEITDLDSLDTYVR